MVFFNREHAGELLAAKLERYKSCNGVVLGVPRGGVPVACRVAAALHLPLDLVMVKKIGHPLQPEYAIGAVSLTERILVPHSEVSDDYIEERTAAIRQKMKAQYRSFRGDSVSVDLKGKTVIVVDDGIATGNTLMAAIQMLRKQEPAAIIVAAPVSSSSAQYKLQQVADAVEIVSVPAHFSGVGQWYEEFQQLTDEDVRAEILKFNTGQSTNTGQSNNT